MPRKPRTKTDSIEQEIERALNPGAFIPDRACFSFVSDLDEVAAKIARLTANDPSRAVTLYETFLAASYAKIEELDDSSGSFGQFVEELYCGWIKARQVEGANPDETASRLLTWIDEDEYGFCYQLERDAALSNFESARRCFERLVAGAGPSGEPSFLEQAKARWNERQGKTK